MKGIPTIYKHRLFRSRLEARWAAFFDLLHWKYEYEPYDLPGWIPDFSLYGHKEVLVEVKPYSKLAEFDTKRLKDTLLIRRLVEARHTVAPYTEIPEILLLGATIHEDHGTPYIGWLGELDPTAWFDWDRAILNRRRRWGFYHRSGSFRDRMTNEYDGDHHIKHPSFEAVQKLWNEAGNKVMWKRPRHRR